MKRGWGRASSLGLGAALAVCFLGCELIGGIHDRTLAGAGGETSASVAGSSSKATGTASSSRSSAASSGTGGVAASSTTTSASTSATTSTGAGGSETCDGGVVDVSSDPNNCGRCGRSCIQGTCSGGMCPVEPMTPNDDVGSNVNELAVDDTHLYWGSAGLATTPSDAIEKVVKTGGTVSVVYPVATPRVTVVGATIYYTSSMAGVVGSVGTDGSNQMNLAMGEILPSTVVSDGVNVYYTTQKAGAGVRWVPAAGGQASSFSATTGTSLGLCLDATTVYWSSGSFVYGEVKSGGVQPTQLASGLQSPGRPTVDASWVYFSDDKAMKVYRAPRSGSESLQTLASGQSLPGEALIVGARLYWLQKMAGTVMSANPDGTDPVTVAVQGTFAQGLTSDGTYLYWTAPDAGGVWRIWRTPI